MITISYGLNNSQTVDETRYSTVLSVLQSADLRSFLGFGDNVEARVNGVSVDTSYPLAPGDRVDLVTTANKKG